MRSTALGVLGLALAGCAAQPATPKEEAAVWLAEAPRTIHVVVDPVLPAPQAQTRDYQMGKRVGHGLGYGALGALHMIGAGCTGGPLGCVAGVFLAPIGFATGAVLGAVSVDSRDEYHPIDAVEGGGAMLDLAAQGIDLPALTTQALLDEQPRAGKHKLDAAGGEAELRISFDALRLFGGVGNDAPVGLVLGARGDLQTPEGRVHGWSSYAYEGPTRHVSEWRADGARLLREEIARAVRELGNSFAGELSVEPTRSAAARVAAARERRAAPIDPESTREREFSAMPVPDASPPPRRAARKPDPPFGPDAERFARGHDTGGNIVFESEGRDGRCSSYAACGNRDPRELPTNR